MSVGVSKASKKVPKEISKRSMAQILKRPYEKTVKKSRLDKVENPNEEMRRSQMRRSQ